MAENHMGRKLTEEETSRSTVLGLTLESITRLLTEPIPREHLSWRQQGKPVSRDGRYIARFVTYIDAGVVRERLDLVVPGRWSLETREITGTNANMDGEAVTVVEATIGLLLDSGTWVRRSDYGEGKSLKAAASDAFKRAAVRWGIGHELYDLPLLWVKMDGDGKYAKPLEDPAVVFDRKTGGAPRGSTKAVEAPKGKAMPSLEELIEELRDVMADEEVWADAERETVDEYLKQADLEPVKLQRKVEAAKVEAKRRLAEKNELAHADA